MKSIKAAWGLALCLLSAAAIAGGEGGKFKVSSIRTADDGLYIRFSPAPQACNGGTQYRMHARVRHSVSHNYNALVSTLLAAYSAGHTFQYIWFNDLPSGVSSCSNTAGEILELTMAEFTSQ
jgi:hypothetical protein